MPVHDIINGMWAFFAIVASILWGVEYSLTERVLSRISVSSLLTVVMFCGFLMMLAISLITGVYKTDLVTLSESKKTLALVLSIVLSFNVANACIVLSIGDRNATISGLIEVSYPLFIALFSWVFFRENNLTPGTVLGGLLVASGVVLIYLLNQ
ncbi:MAG: EamA family transporter [Limisphaerales bacterium]